MFRYCKICLKKVARYRRVCDSCNKKNRHVRNVSYYKTHKQEIKERIEKWRRNRFRNWKEQYQTYKQRYSLEWEKVFKKNPRCEICHKDLKYFSGNKRNTVTFDHKRRVLIDKTPYSWLMRHTPKKTTNVQRWKKFAFGILCNSCNCHLILKNRKEWLISALKYTIKI